MYLAELQGKLKTKDVDGEDLLTSNVFGFLKYDSTRLYLFKLLNDLGIAVSVEDARQAEIYFWIRFDDNTEPDVVIEAGKYYIVIEAKYKSSFSPATANIKHQIEREMTEGRNTAKQSNRKFKYIAITSDYCRPEEQFTSVKEYTDSPEFIWCNWQRFTKLLTTTQTNDLMTLDLLDLLIKKNLRSYYGFAEWDLSVTMEPASDKNLFFNVEEATYRDVFKGFDHLLSYTPIASDITSIFLVSQHFYFKSQKSIPQIKPSINRLFWEHYE